MATTPHSLLRLERMTMKRNDILSDLYRRFPSLKSGKIEAAYQLMHHTCSNGGKLLLCGNGGSASDAEHIVGELMKGFLLDRRLSKEESKKFSEIPGGAEIASRLQGAIPAISLNSQTSLMTAISNDCSYDIVFAQQIYGYGNEGDCLIALSTSGNSANIVNAVKTAKALGIHSIGITGSRNCELAALCTICIQVPSRETRDVQEFTLPIYHTLCAMLEADFFSSADKQEAIL